MPFASGPAGSFCNVHWYSDVVAGRLVGAAAVAKLHANSSFREALDAARSDLERMRLTGQAPSHPLNFSIRKSTSVRILVGVKLRDAHTAYSPYSEGL